MKEKISTVKNPLTVIAIFAGTAEISGTAILPLLETQSQQIYIWFLMMFPLILIILFFLTLNWNHKVLYAPSDFTNEDNFVNILKKPTIQERISSYKEAEEDEVIDSLPEENSTEEQSTAETTIPTDNNDARETKNSENNDAQLFKNINHNRMQLAQLSELLVLNKLEKEFDSPIQREMMIKVGETKVIFDGVLQVGSSLTGIDIKYMNLNNIANSRRINSSFNHFENLYNSLNNKQKKSFSIILALVTNDNPAELRKDFEQKISRYNFPVQLRVYKLEDLKKEI